MDEEKLEQALIKIDEIQKDCSRCGLCLENCITFQTSGWEHESPRGRIHLSRQLIHGHIEPSAEVLETFDQCLSCQACKETCPQKIDYPLLKNLVQEVRASLHSVKVSKGKKKIFQFAYYLGVPRLRPWLWKIAKWWKRWKLESKGSYLTKHGHQKIKEGFITLAIGCAEDLFSHEMIQDAVNVLERTGFNVQISKKQPCCGAIFNRLLHDDIDSYHSEIYKIGRRKQQNRERKFREWAIRRTVFLTMGCYCHTVESNAESSSLFTSLYSLILEKILQNQIHIALKEPLVVYYQPYCRGNKHTDDAYILLKRVQGLQIIYLKSPAACCGGYCGESFLHPERATRYREYKLENVPADAIILVTSPDCQAQLTVDSLQVLYPIQILAKAQFINS